jgi:DNA replication protein DnaC
MEKDAFAQLAGKIYANEPMPVPVSWGKVFNDDPMVAGAMLDRLLHRSVVINIDGDSYRMRSHRARAEATRRAVTQP